MLQEIRQMMTQLKSYLLQSTELQAMLEPQHQYMQDKLGNSQLFIFRLHYVEVTRGSLSSVISSNIAQRHRFCGYEEINGDVSRSTLTLILCLQRALWKLLCVRAS